MATKVILLGTSHPHIFHRFQYLKDHDASLKVLGYYDSDPEVSQQMLEHINYTRYTEPERLLELDFDIALIHGRDHENPYFIRLAIQHGAKGIFVEKPGAAKPEDFDGLVLELQEKGIVFETGWELHYLETVCFARNLLKDGILGHITEARFHGGCPGGAGAEPWQSSKNNIGGFFYSLGGHVVQVVVDLFGLPNQAVSSIRKLPVQKPHIGFSWVPGLFKSRELNPKKAIGTLAHEDLASAILEYDNMNVHLDFTAWEPSGYLQDWTVDLYGVEGALHLNFDTPGGHLLLKDAKEGWKAGRNEIFPESKYQKGEMLKSAFTQQMDLFFQRVENPNGDMARCDEKMTHELLVLFDALYSSARTRSWVTINKELL
ncbi:hypothetical protein N7540_001789 [Penicillium herquei]|nr:hypothetical protein N7540_001789 [Penicillium herquei]